MNRRQLLPLLLAASACATGPRPGPAPDAPSESAVAAAPAPDVCRVSPTSLRRIAGVEAGTTTLDAALERLGTPPPGPREDRICWMLSDGSGLALFASGRAGDQPIRSLALAKPDAEAAKSCGTTTAVPTPAAFESGLRPGMAPAEVEAVLGAITLDEGGSFGRECCGLEQTGTGDRGPVYGFACTAVLGSFRDGVLASVLVSRYAPPAPEGSR